MTATVLPDNAAGRRAVRVSLMLQARLIKELEARDALRVNLSASSAQSERRERQDQIEGIVERVATEQAGDPGEVGRLLVEAGERLERDDIYGACSTVRSANWRPDLPRPRP